MADEENLNSSWICFEARHCAALYKAYLEQAQFFK